MSALEELDMAPAAGSDGGSFRHWKRVILTPALAATLAGFLISYVFPAKYTSQSLVLVEAPRIPDVVVQRVFSVDLTQHIATIEQQILRSSRLRPMLDRLELLKRGQNPEDVMDDIRLSTTIEPVITDLSLGTGGRTKPDQGSQVPGFYVNYTASTAREAQQICNELTSMLLGEDLKSRQDAIQGTALFLTKQLEDAKQNLDDMDKKLAAFKNQHVPSSLAMDYDNARKVYDDDLAKQSALKMAAQAEQQQQGERMALLNMANLPDSPDFPNRLLFAGGGLIAGLLFGIGVAFWLRYRTKVSNLQE
jgi:uncharacterized protein involved in exopolysaccharide biosynthesis